MSEVYPEDEGVSKPICTAVACFCGKHFVVERTGAPTLLAKVERLERENERLRLTLMTIAHNESPRCVHAETANSALSEIER